MGVKPVVRHKIMTFLNKPNCFCFEPNSDTFLHENILVVEGRIRGKVEDRWMEDPGGSWTGPPRG